MSTWLNMADCVRRMARWKSFCRECSHQKAGTTDTPTHSKQRSGYNSSPREGYRQHCPVLVTRTSAWSQDEQNVPEGR